MQDPLFQLTHEQQLDLSTLFGPAGDAAGQVGNAGEGSLDESPSESATPEDMETEKVEEIMEENKEDESVEKGSLEERIKKIEEHYNEHPIPIYGGVQKRLVTIAKNLRQNRLYRQANAVCDIIDRE